jgi:hypothetical protein
VEGLAQALRRVAHQPDVLLQWRAAIPPVKTVQQEMEELVRVYEQSAISQHASPNRRHPR